MSYGTVIKQLREHRGLSQQALAEEVGKSLPAVSQWEREVVRPRRATAERIDTALGADGRVLAALGYVTDGSDPEVVRRLDAMDARLATLEEFAHEAGGLLRELVEAQRSMAKKLRVQSPSRQAPSAGS